MEEIKVNMEPAKAQLLMSQQIFRPPSEPNRLKRWYRDFLLKQIKQTEPGMDRWKFMHLFFKRRIVQPGLKLMRWVLRKHIVESDSQIPHGWYNNHIRLFRHCFHKANQDMWEKMIYAQHVNTCKQKGIENKYASPKEYVMEKVRQKHDSYRFRNTIIDIWMTEVLEDTADREWLNFAVLRIAKQMGRLYGINEDELMKIPEPGEFPMYLASGPYNPPYFLKHADMTVWQKKELELEEEQ